MPLDRKEPEYRAVAVILTSGECAVLDRLVDESLDDEGVSKAIENLSAPDSVRARFRIAMWFWNGSVPIERRDVLVLDVHNRERFVKALMQDLVNPHWEFP